MAARLSGVVRFIANVEHGVLLELGEEGASASLAARFYGEFGCDPDYDTVAVAGVHCSVGEAERGLCISRTPGTEATESAIRLVRAKHGLVQRLSRPPHGTGQMQATTSGIDWVQDCERFRYDSSSVTIWPGESSRPVRDHLVLEYADQLVFVHRTSRAGGPCAPAATLDQALAFASVESAEAWMEKYRAYDRHPLVLRWRSVALALMDQSDAEVQDGMRG
jgi:hypothetical protein